MNKNYSLPLTTTVKGAIVFCLLIGVATLIYAYASGAALRAWGSVLASVFFFFMVALGGAAFACMQDLLGALWGRPIKRLHESFASFLPVVLIFCLLFFLCIKLGIADADQVYVWIADHHYLHHYVGKRSWLVEDFMLVRVLVLLVIILACVYWQLRQGLRADRLLLQSESSAEQGVRAEALAMAVANRKRLRYWSALLLVVYALCFTFICFDLTMALAPKWFSTLWGGWNFAIMMQTLLAFLLLFMFALKNTPIGKRYGVKQFHDVGKLLFGFTIFFAYLTYAHVLTYWYANMPETSQYFIDRLQQPWLSLVMVLPLCNFLLPMLAFIPKASKWTAPVAIPVCVMVIIAQWATQVVVIAPELDRDHSWSMPLLEFGTFVGFWGLFMCCVSLFSRRFPMLAISDPDLPQG
ncbi:MAG: hypothetical protein OYH77_08010 [Pseudomonadota bacterium]|nr:hypothetical protein [Pseudomonadota bacterium]